VGRGRIAEKGYLDNAERGEQSPVSHTSHRTAEATVCLCVAKGGALHGPKLTPSCYSTSLATLAHACGWAG